MLNATIPEGGALSVPGAFGQVEGGILPGLTGNEMGQAAMGDAFAWISQLTGRSLPELAAEAAASGVARTGREPLVLDWVNGCRSPHNDSTLRGVMCGLDMATTAPDLYTATADGLACGGDHTQLLTSALSCSPVLFWHLWSTQSRQTPTPICRLLWISDRYGRWSQGVRSSSRSSARACRWIASSRRAACPTPRPR